MLRIEKIKISESYQDKTPCFVYDEIALHDMNLIIGPNASGKSQFFNRLKFLKYFHLKGSPTQNMPTTFCANVVFTDDETEEKIKYDLEVTPGPSVTETIKINSKDYLGLENDGKNSLLLNEQTGENVSFLSDRGQSITKQIEAHKEYFPTIYKIGLFFENILCLDADKFNPNSITVGHGQIIPSIGMENISSVILSWKKKFPDLYDKLLSKYRDFFSCVEGFSSQQLLINNDHFEILAAKEKNITSPIMANSMSSGMLRILCLLALPMSRELPIEPRFNPSMIIIDEVDNGLDYERISSVIDYLESEASFFQIIFSSHSPSVCNFVPPEKWHIFRRLASKVKITSPFHIEETKELVAKSQTSNWEIYKNHIANSQLYSVE